jgi:hypothetical protein
LYYFVLFLVFSLIILHFSDLKDTESQLIFKCSFSGYNGDIYWIFIGIIIAHIPMQVLWKTSEESVAFFFSYSGDSAFDFFYWRSFIIIGILNYFFSFSFFRKLGYYLRINCICLFHNSLIHHYPTVMEGSVVK